jgi:hypothetical protein
MSVLPPLLARIDRAGRVTEADARSCIVASAPSPQRDRVTVSKEVGAVAVGYLFDQAAAF